MTALMMEYVRKDGVKPVGKVVLIQQQPIPVAE
jgi:hypothetical protein